MPDFSIASTAVFTVQPLTQPMSSVVIHRSVGSADRAQGKIITPAAQGPIQVFNHLLHRFTIRLPLGHSADFLADGANSLLGWLSPNEGPSTFGRVTPADGIPKKVETLFGYLAG